MVMSFVVYEKDHGSEFDVLDLEYVEIKQFLIRVDMSIGTQLGEVLKGHPGCCCPHTGDSR